MCIFCSFMTRHLTSLLQEDHVIRLKGPEQLPTLRWDCFKLTRVVSYDTFKSTMFIRAFKDISWSSGDEMCSSVKGNGSTVKSGHSENSWFWLESSCWHSVITADRYLLCPHFSCHQWQQRPPEERRLIHQKNNKKQESDVCLKLQQWKTRKNTCASGKSLWEHKQFYVNHITGASRSELGQLAPMGAKHRRGSDREAVINKDTALI